MNISDKVRVVDICLLCMVVGNNIQIWKDISFTYLSLGSHIYSKPGILHMNDAISCIFRKLPGFDMK